MYIEPIRTAEATAPIAAVRATLRVPHRRATNRGDERPYQVVLLLDGERPGVQKGGTVQPPGKKALVQKMKRQFET